MTIPRFSLSHDAFQSVDSLKYVALSTRQFELPPDRPATFAADVAVGNIGGEPRDFRRGIAIESPYEDFDSDAAVERIALRAARADRRHERSR